MLGTPAPTAKITMLIRRPVAEVFNAFVDPRVTTQFWFDRASGALNQGATVTWHWEHYGVSAKVRVVTLDTNRRLVIEWPARAQWDFEERADGTTFVAITASGFEGSPQEQYRQVLDQTEGFNLVIAACKAWLEFGVKLNVVADKAPDFKAAPLHLQ
ncbi:SRPBCC family protein [Diaphorobacter caeni]|uniref:SRPBCC family protein n=1 Tax=Diaphorobacter caeni TaxID=2784387 RepID=UPI001890A529|nr:SRPBCC family protein [Diaphorobacter caeni]MBF5007402.1 SRPBCC family protein [Diaphorobacter caeni]